MRVVGGRLRSRPLAGPKSGAVRPTSDRLREALFNILAHAYGDPLTGAHVLDLFAGTGALGIEAISRGAAYVLFVDEGVEARALLRDLIEHATRREFVHAHRWRRHDLVIWDNRQTMHRARRYPETEEVRDMRRTTIAGDGPTAPQLGMPS